MAALSEADVHAVYALLRSLRLYNRAPTKAELDQIQRLVIALSAIEPRK